MNYDRRLPPTPRALDDSLRSSVAARPVSSGFQTTSLRSSTTSLVGHSLTGSALLPAITVGDEMERDTRGLERRPRGQAKGMILLFCGL